jgi:hypothetical protein
VLTLQVDLDPAPEVHIVELVTYRLPNVILHSALEIIIMFVNINLSVRPPSVEIGFERRK